MKASYWVLGIVVVVVLVVAGVWFGMNFFGGNSTAPSAYSAVYLTTGDIYYGKLSWFPSPHMTNVWYLQRGVDQKGQTQLGLARFKDAFWGPVDEVNFNPTQILFWSPLRNDSQLVQGFENPQSLQQAPQGNVGASGNPAPTATSTGQSSPPAGK